MSPGLNAVPMTGPCWLRIGFKQPRLFLALCLEQRLAELRVLVEVLLQQVDRRQQHGGSLNDIPTIIAGG